MHFVINQPGDDIPRLFVSNTLTSTHARAHTRLQRTFLKILSLAINLSSALNALRPF